MVLWVDRIRRLRLPKKKKSMSWRLDERRTVSLFMGWTRKMRDMRKEAVSGKKGDRSRRIMMELEMCSASWYRWKIVGLGPNAA